MNIQRLFALAVSAGLISWPAVADEGHNHGPAPSAAAGPKLRRFSAVSESFELVGVVDGTKLTVYLDRFDDNSPVKGAKLDLDVSGARVALKEGATGEFEGRLAHALKPGVTAVTATIVAGNETDILAGDLDVHADGHAGTPAGFGWRAYVGWALGTLAGLGLIAWIGRRLRSSRRAGGAA